jgi:K+-transporting ATPase ATPase B chain
VFLALLIAALAAVHVPLGDYMYRVYTSDRDWRVEKAIYLKREQQGGRMVAMTGDGTNDAPALAQADVGVAMNTGTSAAKKAGDMVDLDSDPTKLIEIVEIGKQLLITRGALSTCLGGLIAPFIGIKLIDLVVQLIPGM